jgi:hypothetical protein
MRGQLFKTKQCAALRLGLGNGFQRFNSGHGHGRYTTVIEELQIAIGVQNLAVRIWKHMKDFIDWSFEAKATAGRRRASAAH